MTKKDYVLIAKNVKYAKEDKFEDKLGVFVASLAVDLQDDNPKFDTTRFLEACGFKIKAV